METAENTTAVADATGSDPLPTTREVKSVEAISIEERVERLEKVLRDYIQNPPKLPDAEVLSTRIGAVDGKVSSALQQIQSLSDSLPDRMSRVEERCMTVDTNVQRIADEKGVQLVVPVRDPEHETARVARTFKCDACGTGFSDVVRKAETHSDQKPCPMCGRAVSVVSCCAHKDDA